MANSSIIIRLNEAKENRTLNAFPNGSIQWLHQIHHLFMHRQYIKFNTKSNNNDSNNKDSDKWTYRENSGIDQVM